MLVLTHYKVRSHNLAIRVTRTVPSTHTTASLTRKEVPLNNDQCGEEYAITQLKHATGPQNQSLKINCSFLQ